MNIIWIGGTGRSGTTPLWLALSQHPKIATSRAEMRLFAAPCGTLHLMEAAEQFERIGACVDAFRDAYKGIQEVIKDKAGDISAICEEYIKAVKENPTGAASAMIWRIINQSLHIVGEDMSKPWFCEKTPRNLLAAKALLRVFPESKFIHIKRNPRGVIESWSRMEWSPKQGDLEANARHLGQNWYGPWENVKNDIQGLPNYMEIRLEDICEDQRGQMARVYRFLGLEPVLESKTEFSVQRLNQWQHHKDRGLIERLGAPFDKLMGYEWENAELMAEECGDGW